MIRMIRLMYSFFSVCVLICFFACDSKKQATNLSFSSPEAGSIVRGGQPLVLKLDLPSDAEGVDSVVYAVDGKVISTVRNIDSVSIDTKQFEFGNKVVSATVFMEGQEKTVNSQIVLLPQTPTFYGFKVVNEFPHQSTAFTQGLEYYNGYLYESTGQYDRSTLRRTELETGRVLNSVNLPGQYFGEGLTIVDNRIVQLTWQEGVGLVYDLNTLRKVDEFRYGTNREGWGICYDGERLISSDGTNKLHFLNKSTFKDEGTIGVFNHQGPVRNLNELEFIDGLVYANVYQEDIIVIIDPSNGAVVGEINLIGLYPEMSEKSYDHELNGIAYDRDSKRLLVTGKNWPKLFEIELVAR